MKLYLSERLFLSHWVTLSPYMQTSERPASLSKALEKYWIRRSEVAMGGMLAFFLSFFLSLWLCWVFVSVRGLSLVAASRGHSSSRCVGLSLSRPLLLRSTGSRRAGSAIVAHGPSCSAACGILPDQGSNPCPLHWQADPQPLRHQGSPILFIIIVRDSTC